VISKEEKKGEFEVRDGRTFRSRNCKINQEDAEKGGRGYCFGKPYARESWYAKKREWYKPGQSVVT